jgi:hypothetical protein
MMELPEHLHQRFLNQQQQNRRHWLMQRPDALYVLLVLFLVFGFFLSEKSPRAASPAERLFVSTQAPLVLPEDLKIIPPRLSLPELSLASGKRVGTAKSLRSSELQRREDEPEFQDYYNDNDIYEDDEEEGAMARIEKAIVAPVHLIGKFKDELGVGSLLATVEGKDQKAFPRGSLVLITEMNSDFYRGYIVNVPLSKDERLAAQGKLRVSKSPSEGSARVSLDRVLFYGYGGPVKTSEERWGTLHEDVSVPKSSWIGETLACDGDVGPLFNESRGRMAIFYGRVYMPIT